MDKTDPSCFQPPCMKDNPEFWNPYVAGTKNQERMFAYREFWDCELEPFWAGETITSISGKRISWSTTRNSRNNLGKIGMR